MYMPHQTRSVVGGELHQGQNRENARQSFGSFQIHRELPSIHTKTSNAMDQDHCIALRQKKAEEQLKEKIEFEMLFAYISLLLIY